MTGPAPTDRFAAELERAALAYLQQYASSAEQLRRVLARRLERAVETGRIERGAGEELIRDRIARLIETGLLDDANFAKARARTLRERGGSRLAIAGALAAKGVDRELTREATDAAAGQFSELAAAAALVRRRGLGPYRRTGRSERMQRDLAALARAGFSHSIARVVLAAASPEALAAMVAEQDRG
jgi:regulatory protein